MGGDKVVPIQGLRVELEFELSSIPLKKFYSQLDKDRSIIIFSVLRITVQGVNIIS